MALDFLQSTKKLSTTKTKKKVYGARNFLNILGIFLLKNNNKRQLTLIYHSFILYFFKISILFKSFTYLFYIIQLSYISQVDFCLFYLKFVSIKIIKYFIKIKFLIK